MTDNLQGSMGDAQWARLEGLRRPYRVLPPAAPGAVSYHVAMALTADHFGRQDLAQASLFAAAEATFEAECREIGEERWKADLHGLLAEAQKELLAAVSDDDVIWSATVRAHTLIVQAMAML